MHPFLHARAYLILSTLAPRLAPLQILAQAAPFAMDGRSDTQERPRRRLFESPLSSSVPHRRTLDFASDAWTVREEAASLASLETIENIESVDQFGDEEINSQAYARTQAAAHPVYRDDPVPLAPPPFEPPSRAIEAKPAEHTPSLLAQLPAVLVGLLLNVLDGLSYGVIFFPPVPLFANLESAGLTLFYTSTIVSQLVFSLGGSGFRACIGAQMIEVVPFLHSMSMSVASLLPDSERDEIIATTLATFAASCIVTGAVFFALGFLKLGALVQFFPTHILLGCIGGVGLFLVRTGVEVACGGASRIPNLLNEPARVANLIFTLGLGATLLVCERRFRSPLSVPVALLLAFVGVHIAVFVVPGFELEQARDLGWFFPATATSEPWNAVFRYYRPSLVHWGPVARNLPTMFALTFFGIAHVPINVPALCAATGEDDIDVNKELVGHGISNTLAGLIGSVQNYLVYTNSVMYVRSGAATHGAGLLLAAATAAVMVAGPAIIGYIPIGVVAALILVMGVDLAIESMWDTRGRVRRQEYFTICVTALVMAGYDFMVGIAVGAALSCLFFVFNSARANPVTSHFTCTVAHSTVLRPPTLTRFLRSVGEQVHIVRLGGALFFGTNGKLESQVRTLVESTSTMRYLVLDLQHVTDIDYCTADSFVRMKRVLDKHCVRLVLAGAESAGHKIRGLKAVDLVPEEAAGDDANEVRVFATLNIALEWVENQFIREFYTSKLAHALPGPSTAPISLHSASAASGVALSPLADALGTTPLLGTTPRQTHAHRAARSALREDIVQSQKWTPHPQPLALILQVVNNVSHQPAEFWSRLAPHLTFRCYAPNAALPRGMHFIEAGVLRVQFGTGYYETALAGTVVGDYGVRSHVQVTAEASSRVWSLSADRWRELRRARDVEHGELVAELTSVLLELVIDRYVGMTDYFSIAD